MMFENCHSPQEIASVLRDRFGLPVRLLAGRPIITTNTILGAIVTPPDLGLRILETLDRTRPAPVVVDPDNRTWTFLVTPPRSADPVDPLIRHRLAALQVTVVPGGRHILLPSTDSTHGWHWAGEPAPGVLRMPPRTTILATIDRLTAIKAAV